MRAAMALSLFFGLLCLAQGASRIGASHVVAKPRLNALHMRGGGPTPTIKRPAFINNVVSRIDTDGDGQISLEEMEAQGKLLIDKLTNLYNVTAEYTVSHRQAVTAALGWVALWYGKHFTHSLVFYQTFKATGWPLFKRGWEDLRAAYAKSRDALREQAPELRKAREAVLKNGHKDLSGLMKDYENYKQKLADGKMDADEAKAKMAEAEKEMRTLMKEMDQAQKAMGSLQVLFETVEPGKLKEVVLGMWAGLASCVASATNKACANFGIGLEVGNQISNTVKAVVTPWVQKAKGLGQNALDEASHYAEDKLGGGASGVTKLTLGKWLDFSSGTVSQALGVWLAFKLERSIAVLSVCVLGANTFWDVTKKAVVPPLTGVAKLCGLSGETMKSWVNKLPKNVAKVVAPILASPPWLLAAVGFTSQMAPGGGKMPLTLKVVLGPVILFDKFLRARQSKLLQAASKAGKL